MVSQAPSGYRGGWYLATCSTLAAIVTAFAVQSDSAAGRRSPVTQRGITDRLRPAAGDPRSPAQASQVRMLAAYGKLQLNFEINQGQTDGASSSFRMGTVIRFSSLAMRQCSLCGRAVPGQ
jgi:hypothetical protein